MVEIKDFKHNFEDWPNLTTHQMQKYYFQSPIRQIVDSFRGTVTEVKDGDTIKVEHIDREEPVDVRLARIDAPEKNTIKGREALSFLEQRIGGKEVNVEIDKSNRIGKWNRIIGEVFHDGLKVNDELKIRGYVKDEFT